MTIHSRKLLLCLAMTLGGCMYSPWYKAGYVPDQATFEAGRHCDPAVRERLSHLYVNDHFIHVRLIGSNRTTLSEEPPYRLLVSATSYALDDGYMRIYGVQMTSGSGEKYPVESLQNGLSTGPAGATALPFSVPRQEGRLIAFCEESGDREVQPVSQAFASTDHIFNFVPESNQPISVEVDVEIQSGGRSARRVVRYQLNPEIRRGRFIFISA